MVRSCVGVGLVAFVVAACGSSAPPPAKNRDLMAGTTAGQNRCSLTKSHERPFVIEWDATDLASFEAKAERDVVFVRYEGCQLTVLYGCSDESVPGKLGTYALPLQTSGGVEAVDIEDESKLYAELPLSGDKLSASIDSGNVLHMKYFVSGVVTSTRDIISKKTLAPYPSCAGATHYVWAYNLGAFELTAGARDKGPAGGSTEKRLKAGGDLKSCTSEAAATARACHVPIRLALRAITEPFAVAEVATRGAGASTPDANREAARQVLLSAVKNAQEDSHARREARRKAESGDGAGCLDDLDKLARNHPEDHSDAELRSMCEMRAGRCDAGRSRYRSYLEREMQESGLARDLDRETGARVARYCIGKQGTTRERATRAKAEVLTASSKKDTAACATKGKDLMMAVTELSKGGEQDRAAARDAASYAMNAVACLSGGGRCTDAKALYVQHFKLTNPKATDAQMTTGFNMVATECAVKR